MTGGADGSGGGDNYCNDDSDGGGGGGAGDNEKIRVKMMIMINSNYINKGKNLHTIAKIPGHNKRRKLFHPQMSDFFMKRQEM